MRKIIIAATCAALLGGVSVASAQNTGPTSQDGMKTHSAMDSNAMSMKKKHKMKKMKKGSMSSGMKKDNMSK